MNVFSAPRKSKQEIDKIYFWTATIRNWHHLLTKNEFKQIITNSLQHLSDRQLLKVYGFVIMPNHIHIIWKLLKMNGKELPSASLLKFTAHEFKQRLNAKQLSEYHVDESNKAFEFWQRDSLAIELYSPEVAYQKLEYIHLNPLGEQWNLVTDPVNYEFSSAGFYETGSSTFSFLSHIGDEF